MTIPEEIRPVHHTSMKTILKKTRASPPITPAPTTPLEKRMNVDLASAEGAAIAHARSGGDIGTRMGRSIDHTTSAATGVLKNICKKAIMATASAAVTALQAATTKGAEGAAPVPPIVKAKPAPAQPKAAAAPLST